MSAKTNLHHPVAAETSGERLFFVIAIAFLALVAIIVVGAFLPLAVGVGVAMTAVVAVVGVVGRFFVALLDD
jgi:hypothetical protein